jgi:hypothetical protein
LLAGGCGDEDGGCGEGGPPDLAWSTSQRLSEEIEEKVKE